MITFPYMLLYLLIRRRCVRAEVLCAFFCLLLALRRGTTIGGDTMSPVIIAIAILVVSRYSALKMIPWVVPPLTPSKNLRFARFFPLFCIYVALAGLFYIYLLTPMFVVGDISKVTMLLLIIPIFAFVTKEAAFSLTRMMSGGQNKLGVAAYSIVYTAVQIYQRVYLYNTDDLAAQILAICLYAAIEVKKEKRECIWG